MAAGTTEIDLRPIEVGTTAVFKWRGKPVFVRHRTPEEIERARYAGVHPFYVLLKAAYHLLWFFVEQSLMLLRRIPHLAYVFAVPTTSWLAP